MTNNETELEKEKIQEKKPKLRYYSHYIQGFFWEWFPLSVFRSPFRKWAAKFFS
jgi:hypothetical protein